MRRRRRRAGTCSGRDPRSPAGSPGGAAQAQRPRLRPRSRPHYVEDPDPSHGYRESAMSRLFVTAVVLACWTSVALPASAAAPTLSKDLWATINVCDTLKHDNMMGVRASMPGDGARTKMYVRFTAQYYDRTHQLWTEVKGSGVSRWIYVGRGTDGRDQGGFTFAFDPPKTADTFTLRGAVDYKWTKARQIVRTAHLL